MKSIGTLILALGLMACSAQKVEVKRFRGNSQAPVENSSGPKIDAEPLTYRFAESVEKDSFIYTTGLQKVSFDNSGDIELSRFAATPTSELSTEQKNVLTEICSATGISSSAEKISAVNQLSTGKPVFIYWRSHYSVEYKAVLASLYIKGPVKCLLQVSQNNQTVTFSFDPVPTDANLLRGTKSTEKAVEEVVMSLENQDFQPQKYKEYLEIQQSDDIPFGIKALSASTLTVTPNDQATTCEVRVLDDNRKIADPTEKQIFSFSTTSDSIYEVEKVIPTSAGGRNLDACNMAKPEKTETGFQFGLSCKDIFTIVSEGQGDTCGWVMRVKNREDSQNNIDLGIRLQGIPVSVLDISNPVGAAAAIEESAQNPVRLNQIDLSSFNAQQVAIWERMFDFWLGASPNSYTNLYAGKVNRVTYLGQGGACSMQGVLAYVDSLDTTEVFWCAFAGMRPNDLLENQSPLKIMTINLTMLHEALHARGRDHDFNVPDFQPCKGTSESGALSFDTIVNCQEDYCFGLKDLARIEYILELDYSLMGDPRRFQGQCKTWNDALKLTPADFR